MNSVDKDIEQFEKNLIEINLMREKISDLSENLKNIVSETKDINEIKNFINDEIKYLNNSKELIQKQINDEIRNLKNILENIKNSMEQNNELIINPLTDLTNEKATTILDKINELNNNIEENKNKTDKKLQIIFILLGICIVTLIFNLVLNFI